MSSPDISDDDIRVVVEVLNSKQLSMGPFLERFEQALSITSVQLRGQGRRDGRLRRASVPAASDRAMVTTSFSFVASAYSPDRPTPCSWISTRPR
jgi:hypothetical protein